MHTTNATKFIYFLLLVLLVHEMQIFNNNTDANSIFIASLFIVLIYVFDKMNAMNEPFHFEVTPEKRCDGGPYMRSSSPELQELCKQFSPEDLKEYECDVGFIGRPRQ